MESHGILSCVLFATPRQERERARAHGSISMPHGNASGKHRVAQVVRRGNYSFLTKRTGRRYPWPCLHIAHCSGAD